MGAGPEFGRCEATQGLEAVSECHRLALLATFFVRPKHSSERRRLDLAEFMDWDPVKVWERRFGVEEQPVTETTMRLLLEDYSAGGGWASFCEHRRKAFLAAVKGVEMMHNVQEFKGHAGEPAKPVVPGDVDGLLLANELRLD